MAVVVCCSCSCDLELRPIPSSLQTPHPTPPRQEPRQPSIHHSTPAPVSPPSSIGLGEGASVRQQQGVLEMSEGHGPQPQPASLHGRFTAKQRPKESGDVPEGRQPLPASLPGRASPSPKPKRNKASGNGAKLDVIVSCTVECHSRVDPYRTLGKGLLSPVLYLAHVVRVKGNEVGVWTCGMKGGGWSGDSTNVLL